MKLVTKYVTGTKKVVTKKFKGDGYRRAKGVMETKTKTS